MENKIQKKQVSYCGARTWSMIIGWLQTIGSAYAILRTCRIFLKIDHVYIEANAQEDEEAGRVFLKYMGLALFVTDLINFATIFVSGIILKLGVFQQNAGKLRIWYIVQIITIVLNVIAAVLSVVPENYGEIVENLILILITIFFIWVVNIHRRQLLSDFLRGGSRKA